MTKLICANFYRMYRKKWFWLCVLSMVVLTVAFSVMQYTSMDYTVPLSRVIFLPMSFYGLAVAALISIFVGEDFSDGVIKNKIISGKTTVSIYISNIVVSCTACISVYLLTVTISWAIGVNFFEINVTTGQILKFIVLGFFTCVSYSSIYCMITMIIGNRTVAVAACMGLAFGMLFLCLQTNAVLVQSQNLNGIRKVIYELLHDFNPTGQAAQLSEMKCLRPVSFILADLAVTVVAGSVGIVVFNKKDK